MMKSKHIILALIFLLWTVSACGNQVPLTKSSAPISVQKPEPGKATVTGKVISIMTNKPLSTSVWLAEVHRQGDQGVYVLDAVNSPGIYADENGVFVFNNIVPQEYVIVVGDAEGQNETINDEAGKPKVWNIPADQIFIVGELKVRLTK